MCIELVNPELKFSFKTSVMAANVSPINTGVSGIKFEKVTDRFSFQLAAWTFKEISCTYVPCSQKKQNRRCTFLQCFTK